MFKKILFCLLGSLVLFLMGTASFHAICSYFEEKKFPPPGEMVDIGGYKLHINTVGEGSPTVILEAGCGDFSPTWARICPEIAQFSQVVTYDRAGLGWSEKGPEPRNSQQFVKELHTLLEKANIKPPYILVGHSLGGVNMSLYAQQYPEEVLGLVLVDAAHEKFMYRYQLTPAYKAISKLMQIATPFGIGRFTSYSPELKEHISPELYKAYRSRYIMTKNLLTGYDEYIHSINNWDIHKLFPPHNLLQDKPLIVISRGEPHNLYMMDDKEREKFDQAWEDLQQDHLKKSSRSKRLIAHKSGHCPHWQEPELIIDAIKEIYLEESNHHSMSEVNSKRF